MKDFLWGILRVLSATKLWVVSANLQVTPYSKPSQKRRVGGLSTFQSHTLSLSPIMKVDFMDKNDDALHASLEQLIEDSKDVFIKTLFPETTHKPEVNTKKLAIISVASNFRVSPVTAG